MSETLTQAFNQWSSRPADEKFSSLADLHSATTKSRSMAAQTRGVALKSLRVGVKDVQAYADGNETRPTPVLIGANGNEAEFSHWAFGQVCRQLEAPAHYLRRLPAELAATNLNHGIQSAYEPEPVNLLFTAPSMIQQAGPLTLRASTSGKYTRIWNSDVTGRLLRLVDANPQWQPAPAAFDGSRGLYASDEDMFAFLVDNDRRIFETDKNGGLGRGFFVWNSEVGAASFGITTFFYEYVCGNHRVWGASGVTELRIRHIGNADDRAFMEITREVAKYAESSALGDEGKIKRAMVLRLGENKDEVLDKIFSLPRVDIPRKTLEAGYAKAIEHSDWYGDPNTVWGITGGLTEIARDLPNANDRVKLDRAAGKVMQLAF